MEQKAKSEALELAMKLQKKLYAEPTEGTVIETPMVGIQECESLIGLARKLGSNEDPASRAMADKLRKTKTYTNMPDKEDKKKKKGTLSAQEIQQMKWAHNALRKNKVRTESTKVADFCRQPRNMEYAPAAIQLDVDKATQGWDLELLLMVRHHLSAVYMDRSQIILSPVYAQDDVGVTKA